MAKSKAYQKLLDKRTNVIRAIRFHETSVHSLDVTSKQAISYATITLPIIESSYEKYKTITEKLEDENEFEYDDLEPKDDLVMGVYIQMATKLKEIIEDNQNQSNLNSSAVINQNKGWSK